MPKRDIPTMPPQAAEAAQKVKDSAQQIWLAGLGAFAKAQEQGGKVFEALVEDGVQLQRKTQEAAQAQVAEATHKFSTLAGGLSSRAGQQWDRLEGIFEDRVARALQRLDVASQKELQELRERIDELQAQLSQINARAAAKRTAVRSGEKPTAKPAPRPATKKGRTRA